MKAKQKNEKGSYASENLRVCKELPGSAAARPADKNIFAWARQEKVGTPLSDCEIA